LRRRTIAAAVSSQVVSIPRSSISFRFYIGRRGCARTVYNHVFVSIFRDIVEVWFSLTGGVFREHHTGEET
jgi:hypothetical protein